LPPQTPRPHATYEDLGYRDVFWSARSYEDACDRVALRALLPFRRGRLIEVGAGFGRLADEYAGFDDVVLLDSSDVHVEAARQALEGDARISVELGDALALPHPDASFDVAVCVRVMHHFSDPGPLIAELGRVVRPGGTVVLESANKRNL
jgi:SAM-dependent methyltransferase